MVLNILLLAKATIVRFTQRFLFPFGGTGCDVGGGWIRACNKIKSHFFYRTLMFHKHDEPKEIKLNDMRWVRQCEWKRLEKFHINICTNNEANVSISKKCLM